MQTMVPLYGFGGGSGGTGAALTVTAPAGATVTVSKDGKSKTKVADTDGVAVFKGLSSGDWLLSITDGTQTAQKTVTITADYTTAITFFAATIHVTYPAGSTCTATDGVTTIHATDDSGAWDCVVPNAGTWTVTVVDKGWTDTADITADGQTINIDLSAYYILINGELDPYYQSISRRYGTNGASGSASFTDGAIEVKAPAKGESCNLAYFDRPIDVTNLTTCTMDLQAKGWNGSWYGFAEAPETPGITANTYNSGWVIFGKVSDQSNTLTDKTVTVDLSEQSGNLYLMFGCAGSAYSNYTGMIKVTRILFE